MDISTKQLIIFDLDGTLAPSKLPMDAEAGQLLIDLLKSKKVAIISGGGYPQFETQLLSSLPGTSDNYNNLFILPTSGTRMYVWRGSWTEAYSEHLTPQEKEKIMISLHEALHETGFNNPTKIYGQMIEDRGSQITFSANGQNAPLEVKSAWDPKREKREQIVAILSKKLPGYDARIGGTNSIDITRRGVNKGYAIRKLEEYLKIPLDNMVFVGDALFQGGNDYPAKATGVDSIQVTGPEETKKLIASWLKF